MTEEKKPGKVSKLAKKSLNLVFLVFLAIVSCVLLAVLDLDEYLGWRISATIFIFLLLFIIFGSAASFILGIVSFFRIVRSQGKIRGGFYSILSISFGCLFLIFVYFGYKSYLKFPAKAKQSEAKQNLLKAYNAQMNFYSMNGRYAKNFDEFLWRPSYRYYARYSYFLTEDINIQSNAPIQPFPPPYSLPQGIKAFVADNMFDIIAVANIDNDSTLDVWKIDENKRIRILINDIDNNIDSSELEKMKQRYNNAQSQF